MDGRGSSNDNQDPLAEVERQLAELRAEVQGLRREIRQRGGASEPHGTYCLGLSRNFRSG